MNYRMVRRLLFLATVLSVALCVGGCARIATEVQDGKTVFTFPSSFLVFRTIFLLVLGIVALVLFFVGPILSVVERLRSPIAPSARKQEPTEQIRTVTKPGGEGIVEGIGLLIGPLLVGSCFLFYYGGQIHSGFNDKVILSDSGFTSDVWIESKLHRHQYNFEDIRAIRTRHTVSHAGKMSRVRDSAKITLKSGQQEAIPVNDLLRRAWPEIARKAAAKGIHIEGDF